MDKIKDDAGRGTATNGNMKQALVIAVALWTVLVSGVSAVELPPELKEIVDAAHENCLAQSGVDEATLAAAVKGTLTDDPKLKCFLKCMLMTLQTMRDDGSMDLEMIEASLPEELKAHGAMDTLKQCLPTLGKELCQTAYDMIVCVYKTNPELARLFD